MGDGEPLTCEQFSDRLADFLEREVDERSRASVEAHAVACGDCGPLLADLRKLRIDAANLPELAPSRDLWSGIAARIETPVIELAAAGDGRSAIGGRSTMARRRGAWIGLAAAGLVAITAGTTYLATKRVLTHDRTQSVAAQNSPAAPRQVVASTPDSAAARPDTVAPAPAARPTAIVPVSTSNIDRPSSVADRPSSPFDLEIARLKAIVNRRRSQLDPATLGIVDRNLSVIDDAIAQVRQALRKDPESRFLMESLTNALENKVEVLRTAALLPSRT
jgi:hypothetical protein